MPPSNAALFKKTRRLMREDDWREMKLMGKTSEMPSCNINSSGCLSNHLLDATTDLLIEAREVQRAPLCRLLPSAGRLRPEPRSAG